MAAIVGEKTGIAGEKTAIDREKTPLTGNWQTDQKNKFRYQFYIFYITSHWIQPACGTADIGAGMEMSGPYLKCGLFDGNHVLSDQAASRPDNQEGLWDEDGSAKLSSWRLF